MRFRGRKNITLQFWHENIILNKMNEQLITHYLNRFKWVNIILIGLNGLDLNGCNLYGFL